MARIAVDDGICRIVATPHVRDLTLTPAAIRHRVGLFNAELHKASLALEVLPGAELSWSMMQANLQSYALNGAAYVLIEFPFTHLPSDAGKVLFDIRVAGLKPVIAHPERHPAVIQQPQVLLDLVKAGVLVQLSADSLEGAQGPDVQACAQYLLRKSGVHFLASDGHGSSWRRPMLSRALKVAGGVIGPKGARRLVTANPESVLKGLPIG